MTEYLSVHSLHALAYCERLFYLEEIERLRIADAAVYAGRRLHIELEKEDDELDRVSFSLQSEKWGLIGKIDCIRRRDGQLIPYEHKRGRSANSKSWPSDRLQIIAYAALLTEQTGNNIIEGRIRYHADNKTVRIPINEEAIKELEAATTRARELQSSVERPPVAANERLCVRCSLAPACLPEETRLAKEPERKTLKLFPSEDSRQTIHVLSHGSQVGKKGDRIEVTSPEESSRLFPANEVGQIVLHGFSQISTQMLGLCSEKEIGVHWISGGGRYLGSWQAGSGSVQRRIRQYRALTDEKLKLYLAKKLVEAKVRSQLSFLLRASRESGRNSTQ
ncbi:MAG: CRISPR-associated protein Cas4, partial [Blastocatellia bacterium]|nr:CRISPR-associated protein Cas4 [Blastocatellia bacterium]